MPKLLELNLGGSAEIFGSAPLTIFTFRFLHRQKKCLTLTRKSILGWDDYERRFVALIAERQIENRINPETFEDACLLCSEDEPHYCHRNLVAEYLKECWGNVRVEHLGYNLNS